MYFISKMCNSLPLPIFLLQFFLLNVIVNLIYKLKLIRRFVCNLKRMFLKRCAPEGIKMAMDQKSDVIPVWPRSGYPTEALRRGVGISGSLGGAGTLPTRIWGTI